MTAVHTPEGVGWTSLITAHSRARESRAPAPLFVDPWAEALLAFAGGLGRPAEVESSEMWSMYLDYIPGRTIFYDRHIDAGLAAGARQVVILAAGLDARAARLEIPPGVPVFEVDQAAVLDFKAAALAEHGLDVPHRVPVVADLAGDWASSLCAAGFRRDLPTVWIVEGLLMYFDAAAADRLLATVVTHSAPGSGVALEYFGRPVRVDDMNYASDAERAMFTAVLELFGAGPDAPPAEWFARHGLVTGEVGDVAAELRSHGRGVPPSFGGDGRIDPLVVRLAAGWVAGG